MLETRNLALYASIVATLNGVWVLYHALVRDRPRVRVTASEGEDLYRGDVHVLMIRVSNRGRRDLNVDHLTRVADVWRGTQIWMQELAEAVRQHPRISEGEGHTYILGPVGYEPGMLPTRRWFVVDGAGRVYPLRERYRQRLEAVLLWPIRYVLDYSARRSRAKERRAREARS